eukprot:Gb_36391 [translate_table: standard]
MTCLIRKSRGIRRAESTARRCALGKYRQFAMNLVEENTDGGHERAPTDNLDKYIGKHHWHTHFEKSRFDLHSIPWDLNSSRHVFVAVKGLKLVNYPLSLRLSCEGMEVGFYSPTCPDAESVVRATVQKSFQSDKTIAAALLRLHYHDCFVQGCDGSVLIAGPKAENTASGHSGLRGFDVIENAKKQLEGICPGVVSCADIVALAARDAVALIIWNIYVVKLPEKIVLNVKSNGPDYDVPTGRRDGVVSSAKDASDMPDPTDSIQLLQQKFAAKGLSTSDLVVLNGAHTIGTTACFFIKDRLYNFPPAGDADPTINPSYLGDLRAVCPSDGDDNVRLPLDRGSEFNFDKQFFDNVMQGNGVLESDANMYEDASTRPYIDSYFGLLGGLLGPSFESDFAEAMIRMGIVISIFEMIKAPTHLALARQLDILSDLWTLETLLSTRIMAAITVSKGHDVRIFLRSKAAFHLSLLINLSVEDRLATLGGQNAINRHSVSSTSVENASLQLIGRFDIIAILLKRQARASSILGNARSPKFCALNKEQRPRSSHFSVSSAGIFLAFNLSPCCSPTCVPMQSYVIECHAVKEDSL